MGPVRGEELLDLGREALPVGQAGEPVVVGVVADLGQQLLVPDGRVDVGQHRVQCGAVAVGEGDDVATPVADLEVAGFTRRGHDRRPEQVGHPAPGEGFDLLAVGLRHRDQQRALGGTDRAPAEDVVRVARAVVPDRAVLCGDDQSRFLVQVGREPERHAFSVEQLANGLDDLLRAGLVRRHLLHPPGEVVDPLDTAALARDLAEPPEQQPDHGEHRNDQDPCPRAQRGQQQGDDPDRTTTGETKAIGTSCSRQSWGPGYPAGADDRDREHAARPTTFAARTARIRLNQPSGSVMSARRAARGGRRRRRCRAAGRARG